MPAPCSALSVIIPWSNRPELSKTLPRNLDILGRCAREVEVLVVNCGGNPDLLPRGLEQSATYGLPIRLIDLADHPFNKAFALNMGAYAARGAELLFLDADVILESAPDRPVPPDAFITVARLTESEPIHASTHLDRFVNILRITPRGGTTIELETNNFDFQENSRSAPGIVRVAREPFIRIEGMNSRIQGWGWEDLDLLVRLQAGAGLRRIQEGRALHISHDDLLRDLKERSRSESEGWNYRMCITNYHRGCFIGTYRQDLAVLPPERLAPWADGGVSLFSSND